MSRPQDRVLLFLLNRGTQIVLSYGALQADEGDVVLVTHLFSCFCIVSGRSSPEYGLSVYLMMPSTRSTVLATVLISREALKPTTRWEVVGPDVSVIERNSVHCGHWLIILFFSDSGVGNVEMLLYLASFPILLIFGQYMGLIASARMWRLSKYITCLFLSSSAVPGPDGMTALCNSLTPKAPGDSQHLVNFGQARGTLMRARLPSSLWQSYVCGATWLQTSVLSQTYRVF